MSLLFYKVLHLTALFTLFSLAGGAALHAANGGDKVGNRARGLVGILHGVALVVALVSGFGLLARLELGFDNGWVWIKLALWLAFGVLVTLPYRKPALARPLIWLLPLLGALAAYTALYKPF
jgi:hypothetical protein